MASSTAAADREPLAVKVARRDFGIMTYGMTPPKALTEPEKLTTLAETQTQRLRALPVDGVVLYDIHDEKDRTPDMPRPFPFTATMDGIAWSREHLGPIDVPYVHFRCIAKYTPDEFAENMTKLAKSTDAAVIVGAAADAQVVQVDMPTAYKMRRELAPSTLLGAVAIPERHAAKGTEHERMWQKQTEGGVSFFITQCVYNLEEAKNMLSDYQRHCVKTNTPMAPVLVTLTPCGSAKTLEFLRWLGVKVSKWLENDLLTTTREGGILEESVHALLALLKDLAHYAAIKGIPLGVNIESVAIRKAEIEASVRMVHESRAILAEAAEEGKRFAAAAAAASASSASASTATA